MFGDKLVFDDEPIYPLLRVLQQKCPLATSTLNFLVKLTNDTKHESPLKDHTKVINVQMNHHV